MKLQALLSLALIPFALGACHSGGGGSDARGGTEPISEARVLVSSTGDGRLFAIEGRLAEVAFVQADGTRAENLLAGERSIELVGLDGVGEWLADGTLKLGGYRAIAVTFADDHVDGLTETGEPVELALAQRTFEVTLDEEIELGSAVQFVLEVDLSASVRAEAGEFVLDARVLTNAGREVEDLRGTVTDVSPRRGRFTLDPSGLEGFRGDLDVVVSDATHLYDVDDTPLETVEAFFATLRADLTMVEVTGKLTLGSLEADVVRVLDHAAQLPDRGVEMEGLILYASYTGPGDELPPYVLDSEEGFFVFLIRRIEHGAEIARPVLAELGYPHAIDVHYSSETTRVFGPDGEAIRPGALRPGMLVDVRFAEFDEPPFHASGIEVQRRHLCPAARILDVSGLPESIVVAFDVRTDTLPVERPVEVDVSDASVFLAMRDHPQIRKSQLLPGMQVRLCGSRVRTDTERSYFDAERVYVRPGLLVGAVVDRIAPDRSAIGVSRGQILVSFGRGVTGTPLVVRLSDRTSYRGEVASERELYRRFESLNRAQRLVVSLRGLATGTAEEVAAFELAARVVTLATD